MCVCVCVCVSRQDICMYKLCSSNEAMPNSLFDEHFMDQ